MTCLKAGFSRFKELILITVVIRRKSIILITLS